jgi:CHAD domain-containing protein
MNEQMINAHSTVGEFAHAVIQHEFHRIIKQEEAVLEDVDSEPLHQMRVGMRRLRAAFYIFAPVIALPKKVTIQIVAKVSRRLGTTRDWDVLKDALETDYKPLLSGIELDQMKGALLNLKTHRKHDFSQLKKTLTGSHYKALKRSLQEWLDQPTFQAIAKLPIDSVLPDLLMPQMSQLLLHPGWWADMSPEVSSTQNSAKTLYSLQAQDDEVLHSLRKKVKGVRYQFEFFKAFYDPAYSVYIEDLKSIQDILGQLQDCTVLDEFLTTELTIRLENVLPTVAHRFQQVKRQAWEAWQPLRQRFVDAEFRQNLRSQLIHPCHSSQKIF